MQSVLRDYYGPDGVAPSKGLADYIGRHHRGPRWRRGLHRLAAANSLMIDRMKAIPGQWLRDIDVLRDPLERRLLVRAFSDDALLTDQRRKDLTSILLWSFLLAWSLTGITLAIVARPALPEFKATYTLFFYGLATSLFLPLPFEALLGGARAQLGITWTILVAATSKVVGAWIVLLMGDKAHAGLTETLHRYPRLQAGWERVVRGAQRYGYLFTGILFAIPFMSDTLPLFLLAVMHMRKGIFLAVTFVAIGIRCMLFFFTPDAFRHLQALF